jgi:hypothetical protein
MMVCVVASMSYDKKNEARPSKDPGFLVQTTRAVAGTSHLPTSGQ